MEPFGSKWNRSKRNSSVFSSVNRVLVSYFFKFVSFFIINYSYILPPISLLIHCIFLQCLFVFMVIELVFSLLEAPHPSFMFLVFVHMMFFIPLHRLNKLLHLNYMEQIRTLGKWPRQAEIVILRSEDRQMQDIYSHATSLDLSTKISSKRCPENFDFEMISSSIGLFSIM